MRLSSILCGVMALASIGIGAGPRQAPVIDEVLAMQVALDRSGFSPGEIDGRQGQNLQRAMAAFQQAHNLPATGTVDEETWKQLMTASGNAAPLVAYSLTDADVAGPFTTTIPPTLPDQASLDALNYQSAFEALGERFHASPMLLMTLNPGAAIQHTGEELMVPNVASPFTLSTAATAAASPGPPAAGSRPASAAAPAGPSARPPSNAAAVTVYVTKSTSSLTVEDAMGHVVFHAPVTSGSEHDPLPIGTWKVTGVQQNPKFHYNPDLFWDASPGDRKVTIQSGPNNPVGVVWMDLSKPHYGIHGTPEPSKIGHVESHGCVRLTNWDAERVASMVKPGTRVVFRE